MPAVTTRFEITKHDMRKGRNTGLPVSYSGKQLLFLREGDEHVYLGVR